jgi:hypothetical protein
MLTPLAYRALQAKQLELERQKITDNLKKGLEHRPERDALVERMLPPLALHSSRLRFETPRQCLPLQPHGLCRSS